MVTTSRRWPLGSCSQSTPFGKRSELFNCAKSSSGGIGFSPLFGGPPTWVLTLTCCGLVRSCSSHRYGIGCQGGSPTNLAITFPGWQSAHGAPPVGRFAAQVFSRPHVLEPTRGTVVLSGFVRLLGGGRHFRLAVGGIDSPAAWSRSPRDHSRCNSLRAAAQRATFIGLPFARNRSYTALTIGFAAHRGQRRHVQRRP